MKKFEVSNENIFKVIKNLKKKIKEERGDFLGFDINLNPVYQKQAVDKLKETKQLNRLKK